MSKLRLITRSVINTEDKNNILLSFLTSMLLTNFSFLRPRGVEKKNVHFLELRKSSTLLTVFFFVVLRIGKNIHFLDIAR